MRKKDYYRNWCGAACCLALIMALSGCSASNKEQGNMSSGTPSTNNQQIRGQEAESQQNVTDQNTANQQNMTSQDSENQQNVTGQNIGNQQNVTDQNTANQQNMTSQDIGNQQNVTGQDRGNQQNITDQDTGNQQNATGQGIESPQNITDQDLGYHQYDEPGLHHKFDESAVGHHSSGNVTGQAQGAQQNGASGGVLSGNNGIDLEAAKTIALQNAGVDSANVVFTKAELDYDDGVAEYEVEFVAGSTKYEYEISAADGTVLKSSQEAVEQISGGVSSQASISVEEAKKIALNYAKFTADQVVYTKSELDYDDGRAEYEIEFYAGGKEYSFTIDAVSGTVLEMEID